MLDVELGDAHVDDPWDPAAAPIEVEMRSPSSATERPRPFWDGAVWRLRWSPREAGTWHLVAREGEVVLRDEDVAVTLPAGPSPVEVDGWGFRDADGAPFTAIGLNLAWNNGGGDDDYGRWFEAMAAHGGNTARIWLSDIGGQSPDWARAGACDPVAGALIDDILDRASASGVRVVPVIWAHSQLQTAQWSRWDANPYNASNGGVCEDSACFFTDPAAIALEDRTLACITARFAGHPAVLAWEVMNEVDGVSGVSLAVGEAWAADRADVLRALDPNHPVTWSYAMPATVRTQDWSRADVSQLHSYLLGGLVVGDGVAALQTEPPVLVGEWGLDWVGALNEQDPTGRSWHEANWAALAGGAAGNAWSWWWDDWVEPNDLWFRLDGPATVTSDPALDLPAMGPVDVPVVGDAIAVGRSDGDASLVWVRDPIADWREPGTRQIDGVNVQVLDGDVRGRWFDSVTGDEVAETTACAGAPLPVPPFVGDIVGIATHEPCPEVDDRRCGCGTSGSRGVALASIVGAWAARRRRRLPHGDRWAFGPTLVALGGPPAG